MTKRLIVPLLLSVLLAACGGSEAPAAADPAPAAAAPEAAVADEPALAGEPGVEAGAEAAPAPAADPATDAEAIAAAERAAAQGPALVPGTDYVEIPGGQPFAPLQGQVEVVEVFAYSCGHCAAFDPLITAWKNKLPSDVRFTALPAVFYEQDNFPKAYFAAEAIGAIDRVHAQLFNAMHIERSLRPDASAAQIIDYMAKHGVDAGQMRGTIDSFAVNTRVGRTKQFIVRTGVDATPTVIVNGRYRVRGRSFEDILRITDQLIVRERNAARAGDAG